MAISVYILSVSVCAFFLSEDTFHIQGSGAELGTAQDLPAWPRAPKLTAANIRQLLKHIYFYLSG